METQEQPMETQAVAKESETTPTLTLELSDKSKVIAHPGDKWKAGYVTLSRAAQNRTGWRNVHISKKAFEKFAENLPSIDEAIREKSVQYKLMLTRKQHVLTTRFIREGKEPIHYVSFMHPVEECDSMHAAAEVNHAKTINLTESEFITLKGEIDLLLKVVRSKNSVAENEESRLIDGFRWQYKVTGERCPRICLTQRDCYEDSRNHFRALVCPPPPQMSNFEDLYEYLPVQMIRPSKLELIEHIAYRLVEKNLREVFDHREDEGPPSEGDVQISCMGVDNTMLVSLTKKLLQQLKYRQVYLASELVQIFLYVQGLERVKNNFVKYIQPGGGMLYTRLIDHCFLLAMDEMKKD